MCSTLLLLLSRSQAQGFELSLLHARASAWSTPLFPRAHSQEATTSTKACGVSTVAQYQHLISLARARTQGHLTSRSDVYSFGVVLLEMIAGRRSMDKSRPNGEQNLVEWARPNLGERRRFYRLIDPRLEGHFSIKGAQKVAQIAHKCLCRDPKARPLMSEVVEALKPLIDLKDMACSSQYFQIMLEEANSSSRRTSSGLKKQVSFTRNGHHPVRTFSYSSRASPFLQSLAKPGSVIA